MARIVSTGVYLPKTVVYNDFFSSNLKKSGAAIGTYMTGMSERRHASLEETGVHMATQAAKQAIERSGYDIGDIDTLIGTIVPNQYLYPDDMNLVSKNLGCKNTTVLPINTACSSFLSGLKIANILIKSSSAKVILLAYATNSTSSMINREENYMMFGDGAGAVVMDDGAESFLDFEEESDPTVFYTMRMRSPVFTNKKEYFQIEEDPGIDMIEEQMIRPIDVASRLLSRTQVTPDWFISHQAGVGMLEVWRRQLKLEKHKLIHTFDKYANMFSPNIPVTLDHYTQNGRIARGDTILFFNPAAGGHYISVLWKY